MKRLFTTILFLLLIACCSGQQAFRFAFISDTHIGSPNGAAEDDLRRTVRDINDMNDIEFVVLTGDITELGTNEELRLAKQILDSLDIPYFIIPGNHDTGWSESGGEGFVAVFGYDKFVFTHRGIKFMGCPSGPYVRMSDGHVPRGALLWMDSVLKTTPLHQPLIFLNHYPIDNGLDNWYEITDRLRKYNTQAILCGHGHANRAMNFEDIPGVMGRSNLRARAATGGYNLVDYRDDTMIFRERRPGVETLLPWTGVRTGNRKYDGGKVFSRPAFSINETFRNAKSLWQFASPANIISTPAIAEGRIIFGNQDGVLQAVMEKNGRKSWSLKTGGAIFSSPAIAGKRIVVGSTDGYIYCVTLTGKISWKHRTGAAVLGSPLIVDGTVFIGGSDHRFRALSLETGEERWHFEGLDGPVVSTPVLYDDKIIFGAWDRYLYALDRASGKLVWKWSNGSSIRNYSPASCIPVVHDGVVYVVAPDRYISAIDVRTGATLWRNNDATVRESIGISENGRWVYGKTMQDTVVAYATGREKQSAAWKLHCGFGYEHVPSMLIEKNGKVFFGTRNGVVYCIDPVRRSVIWGHKIDNSMVNTVRLIGRNRLIAATMDGKLALISFED